MSVVIPAFNRVAWLEEALDSVLATGHQPLEVVIVDDGSTDGTLELAQRLAERDPGIVRVLSHPDRGNHGPGATRNHGWRSATSSYICFLDSDDLMRPHRFSVAVSMLDAQPDVDGIYEATVTEILDGGEARRGTVRKVVSFECPSPDRVLEMVTSAGRHWSTDAILLRRTALERTEGFSEDPRLRGFEDLVLWLKLASSSRLVGGSDEPVAIYRLHGANISSTSTLTQLTRPTLAMIEAYRWATATPSVPVPQRSILRRALVEKLFFMAGACRSAGAPAEAVKYLLLALPRVPSVARERRFWGNLVYAMRDALRPQTNS